MLFFALPTDSWSQDSNYYYNHQQLLNKLSICYRQNRNCTWKVLLNGLCWLCILWWRPLTPTNTSLWSFQPQKGHHSILSVSAKGAVRRRRPPLHLPRPAHLSRCIWCSNRWTRRAQGETLLDGGHVAFWHFSANPVRWWRWPASMPADCTTCRRHGHFAPGPHPQPLPSTLTAHPTTRPWYRCDRTVF